MCYTTNSSAEPRDETKYDENLPYRTNGYRADKKMFLKIFRNISYPRGAQQCCRVLPRAVKKRIGIIIFDLSVSVEKPSSPYCVT